MSKQIALVFPGQGSQQIGMLADLAERYDSIKKTFALASGILGYDLWHLIQQGPAEQLNQTEYTQPAMLVADYAMWQVWQQVTDIKPSVVAGHSLGEYAALVAAGVLDFFDAVDIVHQRACLMQQAVELDAGAMAALVGLDNAIVNEVCEQASDQAYQVSAANYNAPGQVVIAGHKQAVEKAIDLAEKANARMAKLIAVSVPAHCHLMAPAEDKLRHALQQITLKTPSIELIHNVDVNSTQDTTAIIDNLVKQITHPVRWVETMEKIAGQVDSVVECGPGKILTKLNKRIVRSLPAMAFGDVASVEKFIQIEETV